MTAGDLARVKVFAIPLPETPSESTTHPELSGDYVPHAITTSGAASGIQVLTNGRILFTRSSYTSPNDVFVIRGLKEEFSLDHLKSITVEQLSKFTADALSGKGLAPAEEFYFDGAEQEIQGWILKPVGFKEGEKKKYPVLLLIHGGPQGAWEDQWSTRWNPQGTQDTNLVQGMLSLTPVLQYSPTKVTSPSLSTRQVLLHSARVRLPAVICSEPLLTLFFLQSSLMPSARTGEESLSSTCRRDGNMF